MAGSQPATLWEEVRRQSLAWAATCWHEVYLPCPSAAMNNRFNGILSCKASRLARAGRPAAAEFSPRTAGAARMASPGTPRRPPTSVDTSLKRVGAGKDVPRPVGSRRHKRCTRVLHVDDCPIYGGCTAWIPASSVPGGEAEDGRDPFDMTDALERGPGADWMTTVMP